MTLRDKTNELGKHLAALVQTADEIDAGMRVIRDAVDGLDAKRVEAQALESRVASLRDELKHLDTLKQTMDRAVAELRSRFA